MEIKIPIVIDNKALEEAIDKRISELKQDGDFVLVTRCKDCKYYEIHKPSVTLNCERNGRLIPMMPDDFCSYAEQKEIEEE